MDPRQRQRLGWIVRFFALLLVLTLLARGTAGAAMASVTVHRPSSGNVTKSVRTTATVSFAGGTPFTVPAGLLVMAVPVQAGQTVKAGDTLAVFDAAEVDRAVNAKRAALQQARTQAAQQTAGDTADPYAAQLAQQQLERAYEETHRIYADGEESVSRAQTKRDEAAAALEKARNAGYADDAEKQAAVENAAAALEAAEDALYSAQKAAEDANNAALSAAQSAEDNRNTALHTLEKEQDDSLTIAFCDNGVGVPPAKLPHLFEQFYRGDEARSDGEGSGLGLYVCQYIVKAHGGTIRAENQGGLHLIMNFRNEKGEV